ncbi:MAG: carboxypeptidase regulatory-like domain-containing protein [Granulicella sp.]
MALMFLAGGVGRAYAQTLGGIEGVVKDSTGAVLPSATVTITNTNTNAVRTAQTDNAGLYNFPAVAPGPYSVKVEASGFQGALRSVTLQVQQKAQADFSMQVGAATQTIEVEGTAPQINSSDTTVGTVIGNKQITDLPLNGRDFLQLISLSAGVTTGFGAPGQAAARQGGSRAQENYSVMGLRGTSNYYTLDGISNTDVNFNLIIMQPSIDAIQEFKVQSGVYPAQFGRQAAQINSLTKSGTNNFHGTVFEFLRNDVLDAKQYDFSGSKPSKNPFKWNQFGFTLGGPVWIPKVYDGHDKLFFLSNYEGYRLRQSANTLYTVPTAAMRAGDFSNLLPGNQLYNPSTKTATGATPYINNQVTNINPVSVQLLQYLPLPNLTTTVVNNNYETVNASPLNKDQFTQRIDYTQSEKTSWFARYTWTSENQLTQGIYKNGSTVVSNGKQAVLSNTHVFSPTIVNDLHLGWNNFKNVAGTELGGVTDVVGSLGIPGLTTPDPLSWGIPNVGGFTNGLSGWGNATSAPFVLNDQTFQIVDNLTWTIGKHAIQLGLDLRDDQYNYYGNEFSRGQFLFQGTMTRSPFSTTGGDAFADFLTGYCYTCADATSLAVTKFRAKSQAYYVDDSWRVTDKLSLSLGLRYELIPPWYDKGQNVVNTILPGAIPNVCCITDLTIAPTLYRAGTGDFYEGHESVRYAAPIQTSRQSLYGGRLVQTDKTNIAPRFGVILTPSPGWSFRAGVGIFYSQDSGIEYFDMARGWGKVNRQGNPTQPNVTYQNFIGANGPILTLVQPNVYGIQPNLKTPYYVQYIFNVQHNIDANTVLEMNYAGSGGHHLDGLQNLNPAIPGTIGNASSRAPFNYLGIVQILQSQNYSHYNSASVKVTRRTAAGLTYVASYTWSKSLDNASAIRGTSTDILPQNSRCLKCDYGYSGFDIPNRFVMSGQYELPFGQGKRWMSRGGGLNAILGGWQIGSIITLQSGLAINTAAGSDRAGTGGYGEIRLNGTGISPNLPKQSRTKDRWYNLAAFTLPAGGTFGNLPRNSLRGPAFFDWDASAIKNFKIHDTKSLEFRFETFNTPNHPNWGTPNPSWSSTNPAAPGAAFTQIRSTANAMRQMQVGLKFVF